MGLCITKEVREMRQKSQNIEKIIEADSQKFKKECKILLLGGGESGKSTIVKQMKIIHQSGYSKEELLTFRPTIYRNIIDSTQAILQAVKKFGLTYTNNDCERLEKKYAGLRIEHDSNFRITPEISEDLSQLWADPTVVQLMDRSSEFYIIDSAPYFFENIKRIGTPDYIPLEQDVLRARTKTTGITETRFNMGQLNIHMFDVGGQRSERRKWIHCFEAVTSIIFCVALSEYDQVLLEEAGQNRMVESLTLFESIINSRWFLRTSIVLFLNKIDLFKIKLQKVPLENYFPEYKGKAAKFILWKFTQVNRARLNIYPHLTQATDTSNIRLVFAAVKVTILQNALRDSTTGLGRTMEPCDYSSS
ncbi:guanine nucleotide binding protein, alpha subunit [Polychytrium aggregatum]|uniref:guanine nucleotide binding protein, alpha subunit n=1 Tax=Polychytrium aggregatum TaxID=110093 RepID=UPI0022FE3ACE|nr:guanine nucleotide binding protein, alpha subunit [Polychytrium aggregatum]KAI9202943.1 guanine nucleotide binding protein, alpha subunit [Polychytrium aggregatum]